MIEPEPQQADIFDYAKQSRDAQIKHSPAEPIAWDASLTRRMRVLLHAKPLLDLKRKEGFLSPELEHYDTLTLATKTMDLIVDTMGLDEELTEAELKQRLTPLVESMDRMAGITPNPAHHDAIMDKVVSSLRNDGDNRRPFEIEYQDFDAEGNAILRLLEFRMVEDHFHPASGTVLRLSNEAVNLYLSALELDIEDAQAAAEAVVHEQLRRGKFSEAVQSARNAHLLSMRYEEKISRALRQTRRDLDQVDWRETMPRLLNEALGHIKNRLDIESSILASADERLGLLSPEDTEAPQVARILDLVRSCRKRHLTVEQQLITARGVFLAEQVRQAFVPQHLAARPDLSSGVLDPLLGMGRGPALEIVSGTLPFFLGAQPASVFSLRRQVLWQLQPRRASPQSEIVIEDPDMADFSRDMPRYPPDLIDSVEERLFQLGAPTLLSELLTQLAGEGESRTVQELASLSALEQYAPEDIALARLRVEQAVGPGLNECGFYGDDLLLIAGRQVDEF